MKTCGQCRSKIRLHVLCSLILIYTVNKKTSCVVISKEKIMHLHNAVYQARRQNPFFAQRTTESRSNSFYDVQKIKKKTKSIDSCQPARHAQTDMSRYFSQMHLAPPPPLSVNICICNQLNERKTAGVLGQEIDQMEYYKCKCIEPVIISSNFAFVVPYHASKFQTYQT